MTTRLVVVLRINTKLVVGIGLQNRTSAHWRELVKLVLSTLLSLVLQHLLGHLHVPKKHDRSTINLGGLGTHNTSAPQ
jgi:hypothetical protein